MIEFLQEFHSGWRYLVLLATLLAILYFAYSLFARSTSAAQDYRAYRIWVGIVDVQILLGILLLLAHLLDNSDWYYDRFTGHWTVMLLALLPAHGMTIYKRLNGEPTPQMRRTLGLVLPIIVLVLMVAGISALGIGVFERLAG